MCAVCVLSSGACLSSPPPPQCVMPLPSSRPHISPGATLSLLEPPTGVLHMASSLGCTLASLQSQICVKNDSHLIPLHLTVVPWQWLEPGVPQAGTVPIAASRKASVLTLRSRLGEVGEAGKCASGTSQPGGRCHMGKARSLRWSAEGLRRPPGTPSGPAWLGPPAQLRLPGLGLRCPAALSALAPPSRERPF